MESVPLKRPLRVVAHPLHSCGGLYLLNITANFSSPRALPSHLRLMC
jgi:hypothetical protein